MMMAPAPNRTCWANVAGRGRRGRGITIGLWCDSVDTGHCPGKPTPGLIGDRRDPAEAAIEECNGVGEVSRLSSA